MKVFFRIEGNYKRLQNKSRGSPFPLHQTEACELKMNKEIEESSKRRRSNRDPSWQENQHKSNYDSTKNFNLKDG